MPLSTPAQIDLQSGLQLHYTFDEGVGDHVGDLSGNLRTGQIHDAPQFNLSTIQWSEGRFGGGVSFDGTYFITVPEWFGIGGQGARTISMWVNTLNPPNSATVLVGWGPNITQQRWHFKFEASSQGIRTENQGGNIFGGIPVVDGAWHHIVSVFPEGGATLADVDHYVDGVLDSEGGNTANAVNTNADPLSGRAVSIGGSPFDANFRFANTMVDDVRIYNRALTPEEIAALAAGEAVVSGAPPILTLGEGFESNPFVDAGSDLTFTAAPVLPATSVTDLKLFLNGEDVSSQLTISAGAEGRSAVFDSLLPDTSYSAEIRATDATGLTSVRKFSFATYSESSFIVEAEDYNFDGGQFINDPVLCNALGGMDGCYFDRISLSGIDSFDSLGAADDTANFDQVYRYSRGLPDREELFDTTLSSDLPRTKHNDSGIGDYDVSLLNAGDWANYTRVFPEADAFKILLRARASAPQVVRLELVTNPTSADQQVALLGNFLLPASTTYDFVPLTDLAGEKILTVKLEGEQTLRLTAVEASNNLNLNYMMFLPATETVILPTIAISDPSDASVHPVGANITFRATADDEDGFVTSVAFAALVNGLEIPLGTDSSAPWEATWSTVPEGIHTVTASATDDDALVGLSLPVTVIVDSTPPVITAVRESPALNAVEMIFSEPLDSSSAGLAGNYDITPALAISSVELSGRRVILSTAPQTADTEYTVTASDIKDAHGVSQASTSGSFTAGQSTLLYGLELYLPFDDGSGGAAADLSGFGRAASMYDAPAFQALPIVWADGQFSGAVNFDGSYFLGVPGYYGIGAAAPRTISMWIKTEWVPTGANALLGWGRNATSQRWHLKLENSAAGQGALRTENQGGNMFGSIPVNDGEWHHIVAVFPEFGAVVGDVDHYVDGVLDPAKSGTTGTPVDTSIDPLLASMVTVGGGPLNAELRRVTAVIDDVRLYNRALIDTEIQALFEGEGVLSGGPGPLASLSIERSGVGSITIRWDSGILQSTPAIGGEWTTVEGASNPHTLSPDVTAFYRVVIQDE